MENKDRIIFIDIYRAIAVLLMVQGHTVHTFLNETYATYENVPYLIWHTLRGLTAPIFMFSSGTVFTYLLFKEEGSGRIKKGFMRFVMLLTVAYLLRYPSYTIFTFDHVTMQAWKSFFIVDALHLIGFGILCIVLMHLAGRRFFKKYNPLFLIAAVSFFAVTPFVVNVNWIQYMPIVFANYLTSQYGSLFPLFPYTGFVLVGAVFGQYIAVNRGIHLQEKFIKNTSFVALGLILASYMLMVFKLKAADIGYFEMINRSGFILLLAAFLMFITKKLNRIHWMIKALGRHTLMIYAVHLIILYGCLWFPGYYNIEGKSFNPLQTIMAAVLMEALMISMIYIIEKRKSAKRLPATAQYNI